MKIRKRWGRDRGTYYLYTPYPIVNCPRCGRPYILSHVDISDRGVITPAIICPYPTCGLMADLVFKNWDRREQKMWRLRAS